MHGAVSVTAVRAALYFGSRCMEQMRACVEKCPSQPIDFLVMRGIEPTASAMRSGSTCRRKV